MLSEPVLCTVIRLPIDDCCRFTSSVFRLNNGNEKKNRSFQLFPKKFYGYHSVLPAVPICSYFKR